MIRTFCTHRVRRTEELTSSLWTFAPVTDGGAEERRVAVPSCWETYPGYENFRGVGRYTTQFYAEGNVRLVFEGVSHTARVFVDGREAARHYNAYTPFAAVVKGLAAGMHTLTVEADNRFSAESALHVPNDYMSYGGISRPVSLEHVGDAWIERVHVTPACKDGVWHAHVRVFIKSLKNGGAMSASVTIDGQTLAFPPRTMSEGETVFEGDMAFEHAAPWSPETPVLYTAVFELLSPEGDVLDIDGLRTEICRADHSDPTNVGFRFDTGHGILSYVSDTAYSDEIADQYVGSRVLLLPVTTPMGNRIHFHLCTDDAITFIDRVRPELAVFVHLGIVILRKGADDQARMAEEATGIRTIAARDLMTIDVGDEIVVGDAEAHDEPWIPDSAPDPDI